MALGATHWQTMHKVLLPAARASIISGVVLGMARALGEALAVALVIGDVNVLDVKTYGIRALLKPFTTMTVTITDGVNNITINPQGGAARYMLALVLLVITFMCPIGNAVTGTLTLGSPRSANISARVGCTLPASSQARLCSTTGWPSQRQGMRKRVKALLSTGSCNAASAQLRPPSADTMTLAIRPVPE